MSDKTKSIKVAAIIISDARNIFSLILSDSMVENSVVMKLTIYNQPTTRLGTRKTFARLTFTSRRLCQSSKSISLSTVIKYTVTMSVYLF